MSMLRDRTGDVATGNPPDAAPRRASWAERRRSSLLTSLFAEQQPRRSSDPVVPPAPWTLAPAFLTAPNYAQEVQETPVPGRWRGPGRVFGKAKAADMDESNEDDEEEESDREQPSPRRVSLVGLFRDPVHFLRKPPAPRRPPPQSNAPTFRPTLLSRLSSASSASSWSDSAEGACPPYCADEIDPLEGLGTPGLSGRRPSLLDRRRLRSTSSLHSFSTTSSYCTASSGTSTELEMTISNFLDRKSVFLALPPVPSSAPNTPSYAPTLETVWEQSSASRQRHSA